VLCEIVHAKVEVEWEQQAKALSSGDQCSDGLQGWASNHVLRLRPLPRSENLDHRARSSWFYAGFTFAFMSTLAILTLQCIRFIFPKLESESESEHRPFSRRGSRLELLAISPVPCAHSIP
jgi:hypothetical protein